MVAAAEAGADVLFVAPTGSGKSIAYWVPGIVAGGLTIVVSPLIALMVDQVARLAQLGVPAVCVHSQMGSADRSAAMNRAVDADLRFLYLAPERLGTAGVLSWLQCLAVRRFVVDEAHCISSWGHDFRPDYRRLGTAIVACGRPPIGAFTATATPRVRDDIIESLGLRHPVGKVTGFVRENLTMSVVRCRGTREKIDRLLERVRGGEGRSLVYCGRRRSADEVALLLSAAGVPAASYHGALGGEERQAVYEQFAAGNLRVIAATSAFGMGVDFPDIGQVIHFDFPGSLEEYYQQAGRAGRSGQPAECVLLFSPQDRRLQEYFIEQAYPDRATVRVVYREMLRVGGGRIADWRPRLPGVDASAVRAAVALLERAGVVEPDGAIRRLAGAPVDFDHQERLKEHAYARMSQVVDYARSRSCRHHRIADYFGEEGVARTCRSCDNCLNPVRATAVTVAPRDVESALTCVARFAGRLGAARISLILRGERDAWTTSNPWVADMPFFGALAGWDLERIRDLVSTLVDLGLVARGHSRMPTLSLNERGHAVVSRKERCVVTLELASGPPALRRGRLASAGSPQSGLSGQVLARLEALRQWRRETARRMEVPAYVILHDKTLAAIAQRWPATAHDLAQVAGIGPAKLARYGTELLALLGRG